MTYFGVPNSTQLTQHFRFFFASFVFFFFLSLVALDCKLFDFFLYMYWLCIFRLLTNLSNLLCNIRVSWRKLNWIELTWCSKWKFKKQHQQQQKRKKKEKKRACYKINTFRKFGNSVGAHHSKQTWPICSRPWIRHGNIRLHSFLRQWANHRAL